jgi:hypothetical protein
MTSAVSTSSLAADHHLIKHSYDQAVMRTARLASYGESGELLELSSDIIGRQTQLAVDDMIHLAISLRRLIDGVAIESSALNIDVPLIILLRHENRIVGHRVDGAVALRTLVNKLIHSTRIEIINFGYQSMPDLSEREALAQILDLAGNKIRPVCAVRADTKTRWLFHLSELCVAASKLLEIAADKAADARLLLDDL